MVSAWIKVNNLAQFSGNEEQINYIESFTGDTGQTIFYVAHLLPGGFAVVAADDFIEPVIGFSSNGIYSSSRNNPLWSLISHDVKGRLAAINDMSGMESEIQNVRILEALEKWSYYFNLAADSDNADLSGSEISLPDIRVKPLIESQWGQANCCSQSCYNYYTPNRYPCGCIAIVLAQLMRYYQYPTTQIALQYYDITIDGTAYIASPRGSDGFGSSYIWDLMVLSPDCSITKAQRAAIGALCYDASVAVNTNFNSGISYSDTHKARNALVNVFKFGGAVIAYDFEKNINSGLIDMINPNLDAGSPVIITLRRDGGGHTVLCDGYGYICETMYHHLNMGWEGVNDIWYNLPETDTSKYGYNFITDCIYNIHKNQSNGEFVSGRILDSDLNPLSDVQVFAEPVDKSVCFETVSDDKGIYAFDCLDSNTEYIIRPRIEGYSFTEKSVTTGISLNDKSVSGNVWGVDFAAEVKGDFDRDGDIDVEDFSILLKAWNSRPGMLSWNPDCDISIPRDDVIDSLDLTVFVQNWISTNK